MNRLNVKHYLHIYKRRKEMQESGLTKPRKEIIEFTANFVEVLSKMPLEEELEIRDHTFYDSRGKMIASVPQPND